MRNCASRRDILQAMPGTQAELTARSGWSRHTIRRGLQKLRDADLCHIVGWQPPNGSGNFIAIHGVGPGPDALCELQPLTPSEKWAIRVEVLGRGILRKQDCDRRWRLKARQGLVRDPLVAALFGR